MKISKYYVPMSVILGDHRIPPVHAWSPFTYLEQDFGSGFHLPVGSIIDTAHMHQEGM